MNHSDSRSTRHLFQDSIFEASEQKVLDAFLTQATHLKCLKEIQSDKTTLPISDDCKVAFGLRYTPEKEQGQKQILLDCFRFIMIALLQETSRFIISYNMNRGNALRYCHDMCRELNSYNISFATRLLDIPAFSRIASSIPQHQHDGIYSSLHHLQL